MEGVMTVKIPKRRRPWRPPMLRCRVCLREIDDLAKGVCVDRAACEKRQLALFGADGK